MAETGPTPGERDGDRYYYVRADRDGRLSSGPVHAAAATPLDTLDDLDRLIAERVTKDPSFQGLIDDAMRRATIVDELLVARRAAGLSQKAVAQKMGNKQPTVSEFEAESSDPRLSTLQRYARAVGGRIEIVFVADERTGDRDD